MRLDNTTQPKQRPLLLSMPNFKLPHSHNIQYTNFQIPNGIILFARNLHLNRSVFIPQAETHTQVVQKFPLPNLPYDPVNHQEVTFLHSLVLPPHLCLLPAFPLLRVHPLISICSLISCVTCQSRVTRSFCSVSTNPPPS